MNSKPVDIIHISPYLSPSCDSPPNGTARVLNLLWSSVASFNQHFLVSESGASAGQCRVESPRDARGLNRLVHVPVTGSLNHRHTDDVLQHSHQFALAALPYLADVLRHTAKPFFLLHGCEALIFGARCRDILRRNGFRRGKWCLQTHFWLPDFLEMTRRLQQDRECDTAWIPPTRDLECRISEVYSAINAMDQVCIESPLMLSGSGLELHLQRGTLLVDPLVAVSPEFNIEPSILSRHERTPSVITVGRCSVEKGHHKVISAFKAAVQKGAISRNTHLRVIASARQGDEYPHQCAYRRALTRSSEESGYSVSISSGLSTADLAECFRNSAVVAMASEYEPFGMIALEALACGCHVVLSDTVGARFAIQQHPRVTLFNLNEKGGLESALTSALQQRIKSKFSYTERPDSFGATNWAPQSLVRTIERRML